MWKKIFESKLLRIFFSVTLIYFAFRKIDVIHLVAELSMVPKWFIGVILIYLSIGVVIGGLRWAILVIDRPGVKDVWNFTRATFLGAFYSLFFPSMVAGDMLKWLPLLDKYSDLSKTKLASSVLIDRVIGLSAFSIMGFISLLIGRSLNYQFPDYLLWLFSVLAIGVIVFYIFVFTIDFEKFLRKFTDKIKILETLLEVVSVFKKGNKKKILYCFLISLVVEPIWILPVWFYSLIFGVGISLLQVFIFVPVINLILVLPISVAGFGARENMFLFFFSQLGLPDEKILLVSTFNGLMQVLVALVGGLLSLF